MTAAPVYKLHHGRYRGLTWQDEQNDIVWLLGVGWHESGSRDDAYAVLKRRDEAGTLMPTEEDYLDLELTLEQAYSFAAQVAEQGPALMEKAREHPGEEVRGVIAERLGVGVIVEVVVVAGEEQSLEETWIGFQTANRHKRSVGNWACAAPAFGTADLNRLVALNWRWS